MGDIYLHSDLTEVTHGLTNRAYVHLISVLSTMSRQGTWPRLSLADAVAADSRPRASDEDQRPGVEVIAELVSAGLLLDVDGGTVAIGERIAHLVRNTLPPDWDDDETPAGQ